MRNFFSSRWFTLLLYITVPTAVYFGNIEVQSYLGRQAIKGTGLTSYGLESARRLAAEDGKLVLVDVSAIWCSNCRKLDMEVFSNEEVKEIIRRDFVFSRLEYESEEGQAFLKERNVTGVPTLWILEPAAGDARRLEVTYDPAAFAQQLERVADQSP